MDDIEHELIQAGKVRREKLRSTFDHGADLGQWVGKGVGLVSALALLSAYYAAVWAFTGSLILSKRVARYRKDRDLPEDAPRRIPARVRAEVARRQDWLCEFGNQPLPSNGFHVSHVVPRGEGGTDDPSNLVASCVRHIMMKTEYGDSGFRTGLLSDPARRKCGKRLTSGHKPQGSNSADRPAGVGVDERVPMNDFEDFMRDASLIRRERVQQAIDRGGRVGTKIGKGVGVVLAFAVLAGYYVMIWIFNVVYAVAQWLPKRMRSEEQNAYQHQQMRDLSYRAEHDFALMYCDYGGGALRRGERCVTKDRRRLLFGLDYDCFMVVTCGHHANERANFRGDFNDFKRFIKQNREYQICGFGR